MDQDYAELLVDGQRILRALLKDIKHASQTIHVSIFLFFRDPIGEEVAEALAVKARAGADVRVLLNVQKTAMGDPFSTGEKEMMKHDPNIDYDPTNVQPMCSRMVAAGVRVRDTNIDYDTQVEVKDPRLRSVAKQIRGAIAIDDMHVDHRKIIVIDGRIGYCGGANIGAQYMFHVPFDPDKDAKEEGAERRRAGLSEPWWKWHDSLTRFEGPIAQELEAQFHERWVLDGGDDYAPVEMLASKRPVRGQPVSSTRIFHNEPNEQPNAVRELYLRLIAEARQSIFIENPYLYQPALVSALRAAKTARPELEVCLIVPSGRHNDNAFSQDAQEYEYERCIGCGIEVREYQNHFNHLKIAVFDERYSIHGSTNLNCRSLEDDKDFELVILVDDAPFARSVLGQVRDVDMTHSRRIEASEVRNGFAGMRRRVRDPRTLLLLYKRLL